MIRETGLLLDRAVTGVWRSGELMADTRDHLLFTARRLGMVGT